MIKIKMGRMEIEPNSPLAGGGRGVIITLVRPRMGAVVFNLI